MPILARFWTTWKFGGEYLQNGWKYSKSDKYLIYRVSSRVRRKKSGELWSTNYAGLEAKSYPPKSDFFARPYYSPKGCCASIFYKR